MIRMITPERCFQLYLSLKTHFTTEKYDAIKYNGRIKNSTLSDLQARNDRGLFIHTAKMFDNVQHAASFFVANFAYGNFYPVDDHDKAESMYITWQRKRQSLHKTFSDDLDALSSMGLSYQELITTEKFPPLFVALKNGKVNIETLTIMNKLENFSDSWKSTFHLWKDDLLRIRKLESFIKFDEAKFTTTYNTFKENLVLP
jgi:hypothetical protein